MRFLRELSEFGMLPPKLAYEMSKNPRLGNLPMKSGRSPCMFWLRLMSKKKSLVSLVMADGIVPEKLLRLKSMKVKLVRDVIVFSTLPSRLLYERRKNERFVRLRKESGTLPWRSLS